MLAQGLFVFLKFINPSSFVFALVTEILHSFMLRLLVYFQMTLCCGFVATPVTAILHSFMLGALVSGEITLFNSFVATLVTTIPLHSAGPACVCLELTY